MYDFRALSSRDFEILVRDLLQSHLGVQIESFKPGKDEGIDLRFSDSSGRQAIVQCKHYVGSGINALIRTLRTERATIDQLPAQRYILATSLPLSPANKRSLKAIVGPRCLAEADILGSEDLNNLLGQHPETERQHIKLWLPSSTVLERLLKSGVYMESAEVLERARAKLKFYVRNRSFGQALNLTREHGYCIISGIPGIGKTFLAEVLFLYYCWEGYTPIVVRQNISEAFDTLSPLDRQVFLYDDFLGMTSFQEKLEKNEEQGIINFLHHIEENKGRVKLIFTTREYILRQAKSTYEKLANSTLEISKCILELRAYSRRDKATILFNHIYFSTLSAAAIRELCRPEYLIAIVDHRNYSPRIVDWMTQQQYGRNIPPQDYPGKFLAMLDNPFDLWQNAYSKHLSPVSKHILLVVATFYDNVSVEDLIIALKAYVDATPSLSGLYVGRLETIESLRELEETFLRIDRLGQSTVVGFHSPSVRDFLRRLVRSDHESVSALVRGMYFFEQFAGLCQLIGGISGHTSSDLSQFVDGDSFTHAMVRAVNHNVRRRVATYIDGGERVVVETTFSSVERNIRSALDILQYTPEPTRQSLSARLFSIVEERLSSDLANVHDAFESLKVALKCDVPPELCSSVTLKLADRLVDHFRRNPTLREFELVRDFIHLYPSKLRESQIDDFVDILCENIDDAFDEEAAQTNTEEEFSELRRLAKSIESEFSLLVDSVIEIIDERERQWRDAQFEEWEEPIEDGEIAREDFTNDELIEMFAKLNDQR